MKCKFLYYSCISIINLHIYEFIIDPQDDLLTVGPIAQLVEHCTDIADGRVECPFRPEFSDLSRCSAQKLRWSNPLINSRCLGNV